MNKKDLENTELYLKAFIETLKETNYSGLEMNIKETRQNLNNLIDISITLAAGMLPETSEIFSQKLKNIFGDPVEQIISLKKDS